MANTNIFEDLLLPDVPHSQFDLSHNVKLTTNFHRITPILCQECLPGDRWQIHTKPFLRTQPLLAPVMDNCDVDVRYFFVPNRIIWDDFEEFITGGKDGLAAPVTPHVTPSDFVNTKFYRDKVASSSLWDYLGYPVRTNSNITDLEFWQSVLHANPNLKINTLPLRAFAQIWNDYYQDRNFIQNPEEIDFSKASGNEHSLVNFAKLLMTRRVAMLKDYFTSALPFAQRGQQVAINLTVPNGSLSGTAAIPSMSVGLVGPNPIMQGSTVVNTDVHYKDGKLYSFLDATNNPGAPSNDMYTIANQIGLNTRPGTATVNLGANLETTLTVNQLRELSALQRYYETNARGGSRYVEQLLARWNVISQDSRLQRAEYLGGSRAPLLISEVMQQTPFEGQSGEQPLGTLGGKAVSSDSCHINHYCYEHGWIIGLMYLRPQTSYYQGIHKQFTRMNNTDYYLPEFANLGEQEIKQQELFFEGHGVHNAEGSGESTFGYTPRYSEYKWLANRLCGDMKGNLKFWSYARELNYDASLNSDFIRPAETSFNDVFAVTDDSDKIISQVNHHISCRRSMPMFPVPELK